VLRGRYALGGGSFLGVMATGVTRLGAEIKRAFADHDAYVQAVDVFTKTANGRLIAQAQLAVTERIGGPSHQDENGRACPAESAATDFSCVPIARPDGTQLPPGSVGLGLEARSNYETSHSLLKIEYAGHSAKFDPNDAGFAPNFNFNELKLVGGFMKKQPDEWSNFRGIFPIAIGSVSMEGTRSGRSSAPTSSGRSRTSPSPRPSSGSTCRAPGTSTRPSTARVSRCPWPGKAAGSSAPTRPRRWPSTPICSGCSPSTTSSAG
jgi:hypothetical protein